jgi:hypothetical protein
MRAGRGRLHASRDEPEPWLLARLAELNGEIKEPFAARAYGDTVDFPAQP